MTTTTDLLASLQAVSCAPSGNIAIQIDLETWGKKPGCAIRSIGASVWDNLTGQRVEGAPTFYVNVCKKSCFDKGLTFDADTVKWWEQQGEAAKAALEVDQVSLTQALNDFRAWFGHIINTFDPLDQNDSVWGNGKEFDVSILEACYAAVHQPAPWPFWASADVRTAVLIGRMFGIDVKGAKPFNGTPHYALDDSIHQGGYTAETLHLIKKVFDVGVATLKGKSGLAMADILAERERQKTAEGWTDAEDDRYVNGELAEAAGTYALYAHGHNYELHSAPDIWPWDENWFKPTTARRNLVKAGALIMADIERLDRANTENNDRG